MKLPEQPKHYPDILFVDAAPYERVDRAHAVSVLLQAYGLACAEAMREECAKACEAIESEAWVKYKKQTFSQHTEGESDGASACAAAIRGIEVER